ncbi:MAG: peptidylprolyl isomerase [Trueperaceae bacterium]|nr:peptidylprolyl isomerase [Trueperaceae bacterium]MCO5173667.1 peptidylprolyl isomerase [Trueperaceae bacterium]
MTRLPASRRALKTLALLATSLLLSGAFAQTGTEAGAAPTDPVVLRLGAYEERASDFAWRFGVTLRGVAAQQGQPYSEEFAASLWSLIPYYLDQRTQEVALVAEARRRGLTPDADKLESTLESVKAGLAEGEEFDAVVRQAGFPGEAALVSMIEESDLIQQLLTAVHDEAAAGVTDDQVRVRYLAERTRFTQPEQYCAKHILVPEEATARDLLTRLALGSDFGELAAEFGTDGTKSRGGDLGCFGLGAMVPEFEAAVVAAPVGESVGPVQTQFGYHLVLVYDHTPARVRPLGEVEGSARELVVSTAADALLNGIIDGAAVLTYPENLPAF